MILVDFWNIVFDTIPKCIQVVSFLLQFVSGEAILFHIFTGLHVYCNCKLDLTCGITVIFGTLEDGSLLINTLASNICFSYRNMVQNGVNALSKIIDAFFEAGLDPTRGFLRFMFAVSPSKQFLKVGSPGFSSHWIGPIHRMSGCLRDQTIQTMTWTGGNRARWGSLYHSAISDVLRTETIQCLIHIQKSLKYNTLFNAEPMKIVQQRSDMSRFRHGTR